ncbi:MAG: NADH-quinone oxidoreductase subunit N [Chloroflexi bacterium]|nr:NADH-quinone oxidoreductase subunit N [Chloroflexota bacterium]
MNYWLFFPELLLVGLAFLLLIADLFLPTSRKHYLAFLGALSLAGVAAAALTLRGEKVSLFSGMFLVDDYALFFKFFFPALGVLVLLASVEYAKKRLTHTGEYYGLILISVLAMMLMTAAGELLTAYISLELLSFSLYIMAAYERDNPKSSEAGLKYILLGAFSSALLLYGISLIYGLAGTTSFEGIGRLVQGGNGPALFLGLALIIAGLGFKLAVVPFHMWAPDVYEGSPLPVTAYLSVASKAAGFALLLRLFATAFAPLMVDWQGVLAGVAAVTMTVGNLVAIQQRNIKRLLAYSAIGQAGYLLLGVVVLSPQAADAILFHLAGYAASNLAAFVAIIAYFNQTGHEDIPDYAGLAERAPFVALTLSIALFSLAGLPFFAGFTTKFYLFLAAAQGGFLWLAALAVLNSLISLYYYLLIVKEMYISPPPPQAGRLPVSILLHGVLGVLLIAVFLIGIYPSPLLTLIQAATRPLFF